MSTEASKKETQVIAIPYSVANTSSGEECLRFDKLYVIVKVSKFSENQSSLDGSLSQKLNNIKLFNQHASEGCFVDNLGNFTSNKTSVLLSEIPTDIEEEISEKNKKHITDKTGAVFFVKLPKYSSTYYFKIWGYGDKTDKLYGPFSRKVGVKPSEGVLSKTAYDDIEITTLRRFSQEHKNEILNPNPNLNSGTNDLSINTLQFSYFVSLPESEKIYFQELPKRFVRITKGQTEDQDSEDSELVKRNLTCKDMTFSNSPGLFLYGEDLITLYRQPQSGEQNPDRYLDIFSIPSILFAKATQDQLNVNDDNGVGEFKLTNDRKLSEEESGYIYFNPFGDSSSLKYVLTDQMYIQNSIYDKRVGFELTISSYDPEKEGNIRDIIKNGSNNTEEKGASICFNVIADDHPLIFISGKPNTKDLIQFKRARDKTEGFPKSSDLALSCRLNSYKDSDSEVTFTVVDSQPYLNETFDQDHFEFIHLNTVRYSDPDNPTIESIEPSVVCINDGNGELTPITTYNYVHKEWYAVPPLDGYEYFIKHNSNFSEDSENEQSAVYEYVKMTEEEDGTKFWLHDFELEGLMDVSLVKRSTGNPDSEDIVPLLLQIDTPNSFLFAQPTLNASTNFVVAKKESKESNKYKDIRGNGTLDYVLNKETIKENNDFNVESLEYEKLEVVDTETQYSEGFRDDIKNELEKLEGLVIFFSQRPFSLSKKEIQSFQKLSGSYINKSYTYLYERRSPHLWPISNIKQNGQPTKQVKSKDILCRYYLQDFSRMNFSNNSLTITLEEAKSWRKMYAIVAVFDSNAMETNFENGVPYLIEYPMYNLTRRSTYLGPRSRSGSKAAKNSKYNKIKLAYVKNSRLRFSNKGDRVNNNITISEVKSELRKQEEDLLDENNILSEDNPNFSEGDLNKILYFYIPTIVSEQSINFCAPLPETGDYKESTEKTKYFRYFFEEGTKFKTKAENKEQYAEGAYYIETGQNTNFGPQRLVFDVGKTITTGDGDDQKHYVEITVNNSASDGILNPSDIDDTFTIINFEDGSEIEVEQSKVVVGNDTESDEENRPIMELKDLTYDEFSLTSTYVESLSKENRLSVDTPLQSFEVEVNYNENE